eukprot:6183062-Pleurochrysis_carterae.AAC.1
MRVLSGDARAHASTRALHGARAACAQHGTRQVLQSAMRASARHKPLTTTRTAGCLPTRTHLARSLHGCACCDAGAGHCLGVRASKLILARVLSAGGKQRDLRLRRHRYKYLGTRIGQRARLTKTCVSACVCVCVCVRVRVCVRACVCARARARACVLRVSDPSAMRVPETELLENKTPCGGRSGAAGGREMQMKRDKHWQLI